MNKVAATLINEGFERCKQEPSLFSRVTEKGTIWCGLYIDDGLLVYTNKEEVEELYATMQSDQYGFKLKAEDNPPDYVGFQIRYFEDSAIGIHADRYVDTIIKAFDPDNQIQEHRMPYDTSIPDSKLAKEAVQPEQLNKKLQHKYRKIIGCLLYLTTTVRVDLLYAVHRLTRFITRCGPTHLKAAEYTLGYLKYTRSKKPMIVYQPGRTEDTLTPNFDVFVDSGYISSEDAKSTSSWITRFNYAPVSWHCGLQSINALSSCEAEYIALTSAFKQAVWTKQLMFGLNVDIGRFRVFEDNIGTIRLTAQATFFKRSKHILNRYHYVRIISASMAEMKYVHTDKQLADLNTKVITTPAKFEKLRNAMMVFSDE